MPEKHGFGIFCQNGMCVINADEIVKIFTLPIPYA